MSEYYKIGYIGWICSAWCAVMTAVLISSGMYLYGGLLLGMYWGAEAYFIYDLKRLHKILEAIKREREKRDR